MTDTALVRSSAVDPEVAAAMQINERLNLVKDALGLKDLTDGEVQLFALVAQRSRLDPFAKQIYAIKRKGKVSYQTGIDGYRSIAARTGEYAGSDEATFEWCSCKEKPDPHPSVARVVVHRIHSSGRMLDQVGVARWHELKPAAGEYNADARWVQMPTNQLAKCAEANGLRKLFPSVLADIYIEDEMAQAGPAENGQLAAAAAKPRAADRLSARRKALEGQVIDPPAAEKPIEGQAVEVTEAQDEAASAPEPAGEDHAGSSAASSDPEGHRAFVVRFNATSGPARPSQAAILKAALRLHPDIPDLGLRNVADWPFLPGAWAALGDALELPKVVD